MLKKLSVHIRGFEKDAIKAPLFIGIEAVCELFLPLLMAGIIDDGINGDGGMAYIWKAGLGMLALSVLSLYCGMTAARSSAVASQGLGRNLRSEMFSKIQDFSFADIDRFSSASLITRLTNDVNTIQLTTMMCLRMLVRAPVQLISALVVCLVMNARLTLVIVVVIPVMCLLLWLIMRSCEKLFTRFQEKIDGLNNTVQENLIGIRVVKAFVRANHERAKFKKSNDELRDAGLAAVMRVILISPVMMLAMYASILGVMWFGGGFVARGELLPGELYAFFSYIVQVLMSVLMVGVCLLMLTRAVACAKRVIEVLEAEPDIADSPESHGRALPESRGKVEFRGVNFKYSASGSGDDVLHGIDLTVEPGQFVAIVGGTGTGKSTLVNLIPRFYDVTGGQVLVDGMDVRDYPLAELRSRIGMVLQTNVLFSGTVRENLLWGRADATEEELVQAAKNAQAYDFIMAMPQGFDTRLDQGGVNVSGGQKQRLCIARAMLRHPAILILDDSTSAVDSATEAEIRRSFSENLKDTTVIIIAQRISSVRYADKIVVLDDDHIAAEGTHEELMQTSDIYREIYQSQQEGAIDNG